MPPAEGPEDVVPGPARDPTRNPGLVPSPLLRYSAASMTPGRSLQSSNRIHQRADLRFGVRGCERDPETSGTARYARITNRGNEKPFFLQDVGKGHRIVFLADDQWKNRAFGFAIWFAGKQLMKHFDILPKRAPAVLTLRSLQEVDRGNRRRGNGGWGRRGINKRSRPIR